VAEDTKAVPFLTAGPRTEVPVRLALANTTKEPLDVVALGLTKWSVKLVDGSGTAWTYQANVEAGQLPATVPAGQRASVDLLTRPDGPSPLRDGLYRLEVSVDTAGDPLKADFTTIKITCRLCPTQR
jgi:hypothetical protein